MLVRAAMTVFTLAAESDHRCRYLTLDSPLRLQDRNSSNSIEPDQDPSRIVMSMITISSAQRLVLAKMSTAEVAVAGQRADPPLLVVVLVSPNSIASKLPPDGWYRQLMPPHCPPQLVPVMVALHPLLPRCRRPRVPSFPSRCRTTAC